MFILVAFDESFAPHCSAMLTSCLDHDEIETVYALVDVLAPATRRRFARHLERHGVRCVFLDIGQHDLAGMPVFGHVSKMTYARLLADLVLPDEIERILYLDSDVVVTDSLVDLWRADLAGCAVGAVVNPGAGHIARLGMSPGASYFNAGVLLIDLPLVREAGLWRAARDYLAAYPERVIFHDQDALNVALEGGWAALDVKWNARFRPHGGTWLPVGSQNSPPRIVHFDGAGLKPWLPSQVAHPYRHMYAAARRRSAWPWYVDPNWRIWLKNALPSPLVRAIRSGRRR